MKNLNYLFFFLLTGMISSCGNKTSSIKEPPKNDSTISKDTTPIIKEKDLTTTSYEGVLPCDKCEGINAYLSIPGDYQSATMSVSHLDNPFVEEEYSYTLNTERGYEKDPDATVYILNWDKPASEQMIFVRETGNDSTIFQIKTNRKRFNDKKNHILVKKM